MFQKKRYFLSIFFCLLFLILCSLPGILPEHAAGDALNTSVSFDLPQTLSEPRVPFAVIDPSVQPSLTLYAKSAVLMDAESGRILYEKNGYEILPMASTTKIMTCILALENGDLNDYAEVSSYASGMPKVHLGARSGEFFRLEDLLYSLMLESHNDSAVIIAEHIAGNTGEFADMMNRKARKIGCDNTFFITPNGLDAVSTSTDGQTHIHSTTAADLARIMSYCITSSPKKEEFLTITRTASHSFTGFQKSGEDYVSDGRTFTCNNHNAFLSMMEGALSGKTGFTANAGYCYVGSLRQEDRTFVVALLACGWPNNKSYKWSDTKKLMSYGLENYTTHPLQEALLSSSDLVIGVTGLSALGQPLGKGCFRAERAAELLGCTMEHHITEEDLARLIASEQGQQKDLKGRTFYAVLHQYEEKEHRAAAEKLVELLRRQGIEHVLVTCATGNRRQSGENTNPWYGRAELPVREAEEEWEPGE